MRILFITGRYGYGDPARGEGIEYQHFTPALEALGHEVEIFDHTYRALYENFAELNCALLYRVEEFRPQLIIFVQHRYEIWTETLDLIRSSGICKVLYWATDDDWKYTVASRYFAAHVDGCVTTYPDKQPYYRKDGCPKVLCSQWATSRSFLAPPKPAAECSYPVSFVGARYGMRTRHIAALEHAGIPVACFGYGWPNGPVPADRIPRIFQDSVISLNFSGSGGLSERLFPSKRQLKARTFEIPGAGGFLLTEWAPLLEHYYAVGSEIEVFQTEREMIDKVRYYLAHLDRRDEACLAAYLRTAEQQTYDDRMAELIDFAESLDLPTRVISGSVQWDHFERYARQHTPVYRGFKMLLNKLCSLLWGEKRGPRAVRQSVFLLSLRLFRGKTYSAIGIPGRMFYGES